MPQYDCRQKIQHPACAKQQIGNSIVWLLLHRTKKGKQYFADLQDADIHCFFKTLRDCVVSNELRYEKRTKQISVRLARDQAAALSGELPASEINKTV